jgi:hypothetical protein
VAAVLFLIYHARRWSYARWVAMTGAREYGEATMLAVMTLIAAALLLSMPSAIGVQHALARTHSPTAAWMGKACFETVYLSTAILVLSTDLRRYAQRIVLAAVVIARVLNTIADYAARVLGRLSSAATVWSSFDGIALLLSLVDSVPLAGLSCTMATSPHQLAERHDQVAPAQEETRVWRLEMVSMFGRQPLDCDDHYDAKTGSDTYSRNDPFVRPAPAQRVPEVCSASFANSSGHLRGAAVIDFVIDHAVQSWDSSPHVSRAFVRLSHSNAVSCGHDRPCPDGRVIS